MKKERKSPQKVFESLKKIRLQKTVKRISMELECYRKKIKS